MDIRHIAFLLLAPAALLLGLGGCQSTASTAAETVASEPTVVRNPFRRISFAAVTDVTVHGMVGVMTMYDFVPILGEPRPTAPVCRLHERAFRQVPGALAMATPSDAVYHHSLQQLEFRVSLGEDIVHRAMVPIEPGPVDGPVLIEIEGQAFSLDQEPAQRIIDQVRFTDCYLILTEDRITLR